MTDRMNQLFGSFTFPTPPPPVDIESGRHPDTNASLSKFNREADAIDKVFVWATKSIQTINASLSEPDTLSSVTAQLDTIDSKLDAVRKRLKRIAIENKQIASLESTSPATVRIRVARYTKLGNDFISIVTSLQKLRETHKALTADSIKRDILNANPHVSESHVQRALDDGDSTKLDSLIQASDPRLRHQVEDLRLRNREIENLSKNIVELHQIFTDMSILIEGQQDLINDIEYNVHDVKASTKKAGDQLVVALDHQRSARKKRICIYTCIIAIILIIVAAIFFPIASQNGWFSGGS